MKLEDIAPGQSLSGIEASRIVSVVATVPHGDGALQLIYKPPDGPIKERLLSRDDEATVAIATAERPFAFDGDGGARVAESGDRTAWRGPGSRTGSGSVRLLLDAEVLSDVQRESA